MEVALKLLTDEKDLINMSATEEEDFQAVADKHFSQNRLSESRKSIRNSMRQSMSNERTFRLTMQDANQLDKDVLNADQINKRRGARGSLRGSFQGSPEPLRESKNTLTDFLLLKQS